MPPVFSKEIKDKLIFTHGLSDQPRTSPCEDVCPAGNPIQKMNSLIEEGRTAEALEYIKCRNPFPAVTGRICPHPCETVCNRNCYDKGISIKNLERFASDNADPAQMGTPARMAPSGKKLAVIGSGPAGLTCAYFSALLGHQVTVFEAGPTMGGIPRNVVPDFRLPKDMVDKEVGHILNVGVRVRTNTAVGRDVDLDDIMARFDACLVSVGAHKERLLDVPGGELARPAVSWLREVNLSMDRNCPGKKVAVIGGGGVAFDAAFTAKHLGAEVVHVICLESPDNMCVLPEEIAEAEETGIKIHHACQVKEVRVQGGQVTGLDCFGVDSFCFDDSGCLNVEMKCNSEFTLEADTIIAAIGLQADVSCLGREDKFALTPRGTMKVDPTTMETSCAGVFAAGDVVSGPSTVATAVGSGRRAAVAIDCFLTGKDISEPLRIRLDENRKPDKSASDELPAPAHVVSFDELMNVDHFEKGPIQEDGHPGSTECSCFPEDTGPGLTPEAAVVESSRCFHCGHCIACGSCVDDCPGHILTLTPDGPVVTYPDECWHCGCCRISCPRGAILYKFPMNMLI